MTGPFRSPPEDGGAHTPRSLSEDGGAARDETQSTPNSSHPVSTRSARSTNEGGTEAAAALLAANRRRRSIRKWIVVGTLPVTVAALLVTGKLLSMYAFAHQSITSYVVGDYEGTIRAGQGQEFLNWFEPYKAPFNVGVGLAGSLQLPEARAKFEEALPLAHGLEVCGVRVNLALVIEQMGDAARDEGDGAGAAELYAEALTVTLETPPECGEPEADEQSSDPERSMGDTLEETEDRLKQKQQEQQQQNSGEGEEPQEQPQQEGPSDEQLEDIEDRLNQGREERQENEDGDGSGSGTDRPW